MSDKTRELIYAANTAHKQKNEVEFQKIAKDLAKNHQRFIDEGDIFDREFALESLIAEYKYSDNNPDFKGVYEDTIQYAKLQKKYAAKRERERLKPIDFGKKFEELLKSKKFKVKFSWAFTKGYSDVEGMHPSFTATKGKFAMQIFLDHAARKEVNIFAGYTTEKKPKFKKTFAYTDHAKVFEYISNILEKKN